ncbi:TPA: phage antirepressor KilAC domain-containing protein [Streptococcus agalactiae]
MKNHLKEYLSNKDEFEEEFIEFLEENEEVVNALIEVKIAFEKYIKEMQLRFETKVFLEALCKQINLMSLKETANLFGISKKVLIKTLLHRRYFYKNKEGVVLPMDRLKGIYFQVKTKRNKKGEIYKRQIFTTAKGRYEILLLLKYYDI